MLKIITGILIFFVCGFIYAGDESKEVPERPLRNIRRAMPDFPTSRNIPLKSGANPSLFELSFLDEELVQHYIKQYTSRGGLEWIEAVMKRGGPYLQFIRMEIEGRNLPMELLYLPVIESQFSANALSKSGASGIWQFMKNSSDPFDMKVNDWVDERRDFWKSTQGALKKLEDNYRQFEDWPLALAAYNAGLGAVSRAVNKTGIKDYWLLCQKKEFKTETIHYVPKFLAVSYILSNSRRFGISPVWAEDPQWARLAVDRPVDLNLLAKEAGIDAEILKSANRELLHNITPSGSGYYLKVRGIDAEKTADVLSRKDLPLIKYYVHTIRSGDTLLALALHYGISVEQILESNPGTNARLLKLGANLVIPAFKETAPFSSKTATETLRFSGTHLVKKGETLWSIAMAFGVAPELLAEANGIGLNDILREGRSIKTPIRE
ncbi:MAG: transglycosylase SLT domain-containing protein [Treponema sp.]|nr:transglycosylase SLT domain-containing protein [Treponema sp.]